MYAKVYTRPFGLCTPTTSVRSISTFAGVLFVVELFGGTILLYSFLQFFGHVILGHRGSFTHCQGYHHLELKAPGSSVGFLTRIGPEKIELVYSRPPPLYKLWPCPSYSGCRDRINLGPKLIRSKCSAATYGMDLVTNFPITQTHGHICCDCLHIGTHMALMKGIFVICFTSSDSSGSCWVALVLFPFSFLGKKVFFFHT